VTLDEFAQRSRPLEPWGEGGKIPWNDPDFSRRMLDEHLSQAHDAASRRAVRIEGHVRWIHEHVLGSGGGRVLDLGCGPGLYTERLARLGHACAGIDFSPASIAYARKRAAAEGLACTYVEQDLRKARLGEDFALVMLLFGELNAFRPEDARDIVGRAFRALAPGGRLLLEAHTHEAVQKTGQGPASWYTAERGLFSAGPHLVLTESFWHADVGVSTRRYAVIEAGSSEVMTCAGSLQAYDDAGYASLLTAAGFATPVSFPSLSGVADASSNELFVLLAEKRA
jgi:SAM-dependent methyltransferase